MIISALLSLDVIPSSGTFSIFHLSSRCSCSLCNLRLHAAFICKIYVIFQPYWNYFSDRYTDLLVQLLSFRWTCTTTNSTRNNGGLCSSISILTWAGGHAHPEACDQLTPKHDVSPSGYLIARSFGCELMRMTTTKWWDKFCDSCLRVGHSSYCT